jgi:orotate phosphoribosyltransferase
VLVRLTNREVLELSKALMKIGSLQFGTFDVGEGKYTTFYLNLSHIPSYPSIFRLCVDLLIKRSKGMSFDAVCGIPVKGLTLASVFSFYLEKPLIYTRNERSKEERRFVIGSIDVGSKVLIVDDIVSSGRTIIRAADMIRNEGYEISDALVLIDRLEGAAELLNKNKILLHSVSDILRIAQVLKKYDMLQEDKFNSIVAEKSK